MNSIEEIKARIIAEAENNKKQKEEAKQPIQKELKDIVKGFVFQNPEKIKTSAQTNRDLEYASNWQKGYIAKQKSSGKKYVSLFINETLLEIVTKEASLSNGKTNRSDIINEILLNHYNK